MENLFIIILSFLPALLYAGLFYISSPYKILNIKKSLYFMFAGFISVGILMIIHDIFPSLNTLDSDLFNPYVKPASYLHFKFFIIVGLLEEVSKLLAFTFFDKNNNELTTKKDHPVATMFYVSMVSLGFSILENIKYAMMSTEPFNTIIARSVTAVIGHMVFGLFMGYWVSFSRLKPRLNNRSIIDIVLLKEEGGRVRLFTLVGLISATILHGIYDLHITLNGFNGLTGLYMLLIMSLLGSIWCFRNLFRLDLKLKKDSEKLNK